MNDDKRSRRNWIIIFGLIGISVAIIRHLIYHNLDKSALLYVGIPYLIASALIWFEPTDVGTKWYHNYIRHFYTSLIVLFLTSVILFEGFICVAFVIPIYLVIILLVFLLHLLSRKLSQRKKGKILSHGFPLILLFSSFEGVTPKLSFPRDNAVTVTKVIDASISDIKEKLVSPMEIDKSSNWLLSIFSMPVQIHANSLSTGDIHKIHFQYNRWFVTNTHHGHMALQLTEVSEDIIRTQFIEDTSYIANYLKLKGTEIKFDQISESQTHVSLTIRYRRLLDPAWYFDPVQKYAIKKTGELLIKEVMTP